jgi:hypothetical protein
MTQPRRKVVVATQPHTFSSALGAALALDPRLDVSLASPADINFETVASTADVVIVSEAAPSLAATIFVLSDSPFSVEIHRDGDVQTRPYEGMAWLIELVASHLPDRFSETESKAPERAADSGRW